MKFETPLCELAYKYGTDKCPQIKHNYTPYYWELFKDKRDSVKKVLELGIGADWILTHKENPIVSPRGSSLRMWRDFFPNAQVYGVDIDKESIMEDDRIETFLLDEEKAQDWIDLIKVIGSDIDLFIDDGRHRLVDNIFVARVLLPLLKKDVIYIIEDTLREDEIQQYLMGYKCETIHLKPGGKRDGMVRIYND